VLVSQQDGRAIARVIDFGIAKAIDHRLAERTVFTEFGQLIERPSISHARRAHASRLRRGRHPR
jgi:hypothetical protein